MYIYDIYIYMMIFVFVKAITPSMHCYASYPASAALWRQTDVLNWLESNQLASLNDRYFICSFTFDRKLFCLRFTYVSLSGNGFRFYQTPTFVIT